MSDEIISTYSSSLLTENLKNLLFISIDIV